MACGPVEANRVEQFHIAGPCVNAEQNRRHPHIYVRHSNVADSRIDCAMFALPVHTYIELEVCLTNTGTTSASTTYDPHLVRTSDDHVPAFPSSPGEFTEATTRDVGTWNATATLQRFLRKRERDLMNDSAGACWRALERKGAACNSCCSAFALHICGSCYLLLCDPCLHTGLCECFTSDSAPRPRTRLLTSGLSSSTTASVASNPHSIMEGPPGDWSLPYLMNLQNYHVYVNAMKVIMFGTDVDVASVCAGHRRLVGTASASVAMSSGHETHNQVVGPPTEEGIQVIEV